MNECLEDWKIRLTRKYTTFFKHMLENYFVNMMPTSLLQEKVTKINFNLHTGTS